MYFIVSVFIGYLWGKSRAYKQATRELKEMMRVLNGLR